MAFVNLNAYTADVMIPEFLGVRSLDSVETAADKDLRYAESSKNLHYGNRRLQPAFPLAGDRDMWDYGVLRQLDSFSTYYYHPFSQYFYLKNRGYGVTLYCCNYSRSGRYPQGYTPHAGISRFFLVARFDMQSTAYPIDFADHMEEDLGFSGCYFNALSYEYYSEEDGRTVDVIILSNAVDGMYMIKDGNAGLSYEYVPASGRHFADVEMHAERLWGIEATNGKQNVTLRYSHAYDPKDWTGDPDYPDRGGGELTLPTWNGDIATGLKEMNGRLYVFTTNSIWTISGSAPSDFYVTKVADVGTFAGDTLQVYDGRIYFLSYDGPAVFDGSSVSYLAKANYRDTIASCGEGAGNRLSIGRIIDDKYILSVETAQGAAYYGSTYGSDMVIVVDLITGAYYTIESMGLSGLVQNSGPTLNRGLVSAFSCTVGKLPPSMLSILNNTTDSFFMAIPCIVGINDNGGKGMGYFSPPYEIEWVSKWIELNLKRKALEEIVLYFTPYCSPFPDGQRDNPLPKLTFTIETEKCEKTKTYVFDPNVQDKQIRFHYKVVGTRFRLRIHADALTPPHTMYPDLMRYDDMTNWWCLKDGIHMVVDTSELDG